MAGLPQRNVQCGTSLVYDVWYRGVFREGKITRPHSFTPPQSIFLDTPLWYYYRPSKVLQWSSSRCFRIIEMKQAVVSASCGWRWKTFSVRELFSILTVKRSSVSASARFTDLEWTLNSAATSRGQWSVVSGHCMTCQSAPTGIWLILGGQQIQIDGPPGPGRQRNNVRSKDKS